MDFKKVQKILLKNDKYVKAFDELSISFEIARSVIEARTQRNITQKELADMVGTGQSSIARLESGDNVPSISFIHRIAKALNMVLLPPLFIPEEDIKYLASSEADTQQIKIKISETRKSLISNPRKALDTATSSGNSQTEIIGGGVYI